MTEKSTVYSVQTVVYRRLSNGSVSILGLHKIASDGGFYWQSPRGGIKENESPANAALRETSEETGIEKPLTFFDLEHSHQFDYTKTDPQTGT